MEKMRFERLYDNRLMRTEEEIQSFEEGLREISENIQETDIIELCRIFDDNTAEDAVMFSLIHIIETFSSEKAFEYTVLGIVNMMESAVNWAKIIIYRCLNDDFSRSMLKDTINNVEPQVRQTMQELLSDIREEDYDRFGVTIDDVLEEPGLELD